MIYYTNHSIRADMKKSILSVIPVLSLLLLLLYPSLSFEGAKNGLLLWFNVVLPTLLPFMLCSSLIVAWGGVPFITKPLAPVFKLLRLSEAGSYTWICGMLCGYPMGAKTAADFVRNGQMRQSEGKRMLAMAGYPSPMFLAGYVRACLPSEIPFFSLLAAIYLPVLLLAPLSRFMYQKKDIRTANADLITLQKAMCCAKHAEDKDKDKNAASPALSFDEMLMNAFEIMVKIGGYIMLFSILALFADHFLPPACAFKPLLLGFIEMTTGIQAISIEMSGAAAAAAMVFSASFGGLSGVFQTCTVIKNAGLSIRHYIVWKLLHAGLASSILILVLCL